MRRGVRALVGLGPRRALYLLALVLIIAVALPTLGLAGSTSPSPSGAQTRDWAKAPAWATESAGAGGQSDEVIVQFARGTNSQAMLHMADAAKANLSKARAGSSNGVPFAVCSSSELTTAQLIDTLKKQPGVVSVEVNGTLGLSGTSVGAPNDPSFLNQWALENTGQSGGVVDADVDALTAWQRTTGSEDVVIAVIDSGVFYEHPDLAANMWKNPGEREQPYDGSDNEGDGYADDLYGIDALNGDSDPLDDCSHGSNVAGIAAAVGNNGVGTTGVAQRAKIMALKAFDHYGCGTLAAVIECIDYVIDQKVAHGVNVVAINASFECDFYSQSLHDAIQAAGDAGIVFVAAAGNRAINVDNAPVYPAAYDCSNVIAVGATDRYDRPADFSNYGAAGIDLFAPGVGVLNTIRPELAAGPGTGTLFYDDMESGSGNWSPSTSSTENPWAITTEANWGSTGSHAWSDSPNGCYQRSSRYTLTSRTINLGSAPKGGTWVGFAALHELGTGDELIVKVSGDNGGSWTGVHLFAGTGEDYYWAKLPESAVTSNFKLQFVMETGAVSEGDHDGVYLDDVCISTKTPMLYYEYTGTSMAAPHVTGTIALLAAAAPESTMSTRVERVLSSADTLSALSGKCVTSGRLNAGKAVMSSAEPPTIREIAPSRGPSDGGTKVDIYGSGFYGVEWAGAGGVTFGGVNALSYTVDSSEHVIAYAPPGTGGSAVQVQVHAAAGVTPDTPAGDFTYVPRPTISAISPAAGPTTGGVKVTINGTGLDEVSSVTFGGVQAKEWWRESSTMLMAIIPVHQAGTVRVQVTAAGGSTADTAADDFTYVATAAVQQTDAKLSYIGAWAQEGSPYASGGSYATASTADSRLTVSFTGSYLSLVAKTAPDGGKALVTVDGVEKGYVDFYSEVTRYQQVVYNTEILEAGPHTVVLSWVEKHNEWSSGYAINVDVVHVLGEFTQAPVPERHQQDLTQLRYTGTWADEWTWWLASECTQRYVNSPGASVNINFDGTYIAWVGKKASNYGMAQVRVDGGEPVTVDLYSRYTQYKQKIFETGMLPDGKHTLSIYWLGAKNPASSNCYISVDALDVFGDITSTTGEAAPITWSYEQSDPRITYVGSWNTRWDGRASAWSFFYTSDPGAGAVVDFRGDSVQIMGKLGPPYGEVAISLDGGEPELVDLYSETDVFRAKLYERTGLSDGPHTLTIKPTGNKNERAVMAAINIDGVKINGYLSQAPTTTRFQQDDPTLVSEGEWSTGTTWSASGGSFWSGDEPGAKMTVTFEGTYLSWVARTTPWYGKAKVTLDGNEDEAVIVDLFNWGVGWKVPVYKTGILDPGTHTLEIEWTGEKYWRSWGTAISVDAFDVIGTLKAATL